MIVDFFIRLAAFAGGLWLVWIVLLSATRTIVLPRGIRDPVTSLVFNLTRAAFLVAIRRARTYEVADRVMSYYAPVTVLLLLPVWMSIATIGYSALFWATGVRPLRQAFAVSGSSLLTLGFAFDLSWAHLVLSFTEAMLGLILVALLISFLPTLYTTFSRRESAVTMLDVRAGTPPTVRELILRHHRIGKLTNGGLQPLFYAWEQLFSEIEESHTSFPALIFFRSPKPLYSWVAASACILDSAAFLRSTVDVPREPQADLCIRAGYLALRSIADFFDVDYNPNPHYPVDAVSVTREEFDALYESLFAEGVPLVQDREQAWVDFAGWRVNYDKVLGELAAMIVAPGSAWSAEGEYRRALPFLTFGAHKSKQSG